MATLAGLLIGAPVIRMRGDYLAIVTLGFGEIIRLLFLSDWLKPYLGGSQGITNIPGIDLGPWEVRGADPRSVFYMVLAFCVLAIYVSWRLQGSRLGRAWMAIREDLVAEVMGINTVISGDGVCGRSSFGFIQWSGTGQRLDLFSLRALKFSSF